MKANDLEMLSAFFDGEAVDPDALADGLRDPSALEFLVECARLRRTVHADSSRPSAEFCESMRERLGQGDRRRASRRRLVQISLAASLALAAGLGGFGLRALFETRPPAIARPVEPVQAPAAAPQPLGEPVSAPVPAKPSRRDMRVPSRRTMPQPSLRMRFDEWRDVVL